MAAACAVDVVPLGIGAATVADRGYARPKDASQTRRPACAPTPLIPAAMVCSKSVTP